MNDFSGLIGLLVEWTAANGTDYAGRVVAVSVDPTRWSQPTLWVRKTDGRFVCIPISDARNP